MLLSTVLRPFPSYLVTVIATVISSSNLLLICDQTLHVSQQITKNLYILILTYTFFIKQARDTQDLVAHLKTFLLVYRLRVFTLVYTLSMMCTCKLILVLYFFDCQTLSLFLLYLFLSSKINVYCKKKKKKKSIFLLLKPSST